MSNDRLKDADLTTIKGGAAVELFQRELEAVLENIADPNTNPEDKRSITLKVELQPAADRDSARVHIQASSKLAPARPAVSQVYVGRRKGKLVAVTYDPAQQDMFDPDAGADVRPLSAVSGNREESAS